MYECNCAPESEEVAGVLCELAQLYMLIQKYRFVYFVNKGLTNCHI